MRCAGIDLRCAADFDDGLRRVAKRARRVDHIIIEKAALTFYITDDVHDLALVGALAALVDDSKAHAHLVGKRTASGNRAYVGGNDDHVLRVFELVEEILRKNRGRVQIVHRDIKEALDLRGMQVHCEHTVSACGFDHVGDELRGDRVTTLGLAVLTGVAEIGHDGGDTAGGCAAARVDHDEQLHKVVVDGLAGGLDDEHVASAHRLVDADGNLAVGKLVDRAVAHRQPQLAAHSLGERTVCVGTEDLDVFTVRNHMKLPP